MAETSAGVADRARGPVTGLEPNAIGVVQEIAQYTPMYGLNQLVHAPLLGTAPHLAWIANAVVWLAIFAAGAMWRFRKDTARV